jgi:hypothetical protein
MKGRRKKLGTKKKIGRKQKKRREDECKDKGKKRMNVGGSDRGLFHETGTVPDASITRSLPALRDRRSNPVSPVKVRALQLQLTFALWFNYVW